MFPQLQFQPTPWNKSVRDTMVATYTQVQTAANLMGKFQGIAPSEQQRQFKSIKTALYEDVRSLTTKLKAGAGSNYKSLNISDNGNIRCRDLHTIFSTIEKKLLNDIRTDNPKEFKYPTAQYLIQDFLYALYYMDKTLATKDVYEARKITTDYVEHFIMGIVS